jgi:hypothetical protein
MRWGSHIDRRSMATTRTLRRRRSRSRSDRRWRNVTAGVAEGDRRDRRGNAMDGVPDARSDRGSEVARRLVTEGRSRRAWRGAVDVQGR